MRRVVLFLGLAWLALAGAAVAQGVGLKRLDTMDQGRAWEAVGRLDLNGRGFCTGALIAPALVLTAAHCLYDRQSRERIDHSGIQFLAGWRNGRASAYRGVRRAVIHPDYDFGGRVTSDRVRNDVALLQLDQPIRNTSVTPFRTAPGPREGGQVGVVSYARDRADAPSLQEVCGVMARRQGVLVMSCDVDFGASGAPVFDLGAGAPRIVSVVSAKAELDGRQVALGSSLERQIEVLRAELDAGRGYGLAPPPLSDRVRVGEARNDTGAKFVRP